MRPKYKSMPYTDCVASLTIFHGSSVFIDLVLIYRGL